MPSLVGFSNPLNQVPGFLIPLFVDHPHNHLLIQNISPTDKILAFSQIDLAIDFNADHAEDTSLGVGDNALWAFAFDENHVLSGPSKQIAISLKARLRKGTFKKLPFLENEVAFFCDDQIRYKRNLSKCFETLHRISPTAATVWRDNVILLPEAKRELSTLTPAMRNPALIGLVRARTIRSVLTVEIPNQLSKADERISLSRTFNLAKALGVEAVHVTQSNIPDMEELNEPIAIVYGLNGIGRMVERKNPNQIRRDTIWSLPWIRGDQLNRVMAKKSPNFTFMILSNNDEQTKAAIALVKRREDTIYVAIFLPPISFGTNRNNSNVFWDNELKQYFDYVFIVGNHSLLEPDSSAPRLAASSRAIKFVRACIDGMIYAAWTTETVNQPKKFKRLFPTDGFCLVGRANREKSDRGPKNVIARCLAGMQNEFLSVRRSRRFVAIGASSIIYSDAMDETSHRVIRLNRDELMRFEHEAERSRDGITTIAFGLEPARITVSSFRSFCFALLESLGWRLVSSREDTDEVTWRLGDVHQSFSFLIKEEFNNDLFEKLIKRQKNVRVLTNFRPFEQMKSRKNSLVTFAHYSSLEYYSNQVSRTQRPVR